MKLPYNFTGTLLPLLPSCKPFRR
uniref:Uncharacterized protein n=1 Tax=Arundo donax TaxID=35708 RepID=A0A0A9A987_ARUDO